MSEALEPATPRTHVPRLGGRWVSAYRALWCLLALGSVGVLASSLFHPMAHPAIVALRTAKGLVVIAVCWILLRRRRDDPVAALLSLAFLNWTITSSVDFTSADALPLLLDRVRFLLFVLALLLFPDGDWRPRWTRTVAASSVGVFLLGVAEIGGILPTRLFLPLAIACVVAAIVALLSRFRSSTSEVTRQQLKWVALGLVAGTSLILGARAGAALSASSPVLAAQPILWEAMFQLGITIAALGFLVSLVRYRLFDAEAAISRSAALAGLTLALVATFAGTEASIEWAGQQYLGMGIGNVSAAMAAAVAAVLLNPLHDRISGWAEQHFQRDLVTLKRELPGLLEDLAGAVSTRALGEAALAQICAAVHATRVGLLVGDELVAATDRSPIDQFPLRIAMRCPSGAPTAWLLLGRRPDGTLYGKEDLDALHQILPALRRALAISVRAEALRAEHRRHAASLDHKLQTLQARLRAVEARLPAAEDAGCHC